MVEAMEASDIRAATEQLRRMAAAIGQAKTEPQPEGLSTAQTIARDEEIDQALMAWSGALADVVLDIFRPAGAAEADCFCGGYHVLGTRRHPDEDDDREVLVGPCPVEDENRHETGP